MISPVTYATTFSFPPHWAGWRVARQIERRVTDVVQRADAARRLSAGAMSFS